MKTNLLTIAIACIVIIFISFGVFHIAKFETSDEGLWKFGRIPAYWDAIKKFELENTYINDKPGVSLALISGIGMVFDPHPENNYAKTGEATLDGNIAVYNTSGIEKMNLSLRLPIIVFNGLFLIYFFWVLKKITANAKISLLSILFIATSPILIGISQIANPDAFLWSFSAAALFSYLALLKTNERKFILLAGLFSGFALLSKYTANILFPAYILLLFSNYFLEFEKIRANHSAKEYFLYGLRNILFVFLISAVIFLFFLPASIKDLNILYEGTLGFSGFKMILLPLIGGLGTVLLDILYQKGKLINTVSKFIFKHRFIIVKATAFLILFVIIFLIIDASIGQKLTHYQSASEDIYHKGKNGFERVIGEYSLLKKILLEFYPLVFSFNPFLLIAISVFLSISIINIREKYLLYVFFASVFPFFYFAGTALSNVLANVRYSIMLYPLLYFLAAISVHELFSQIKAAPWVKKALLLSMVVFLLVPLWTSKPHYLSYTNIFLSKNFFVTDSWGYGSYEAAQYLNSLPNAKDLTIWSNRQGICQFFVGKCLKKQTIDLENFKPDYFVITKRGSLKNRFKWKDKTMAQKPPSYYYDKLENNYEWSIFINNRPGNYVKIIASEEK